MNDTMIQEPTLKQLGYLSGLLDTATELLARREELTGAPWPEATAAVASMRDTEGRTKREVSGMIDSAKTNNGALRTELTRMGVTETAPAATARAYVETGMYRVGEKIFKVLPSRSSDRRYAKELTGSKEDGFTFEYAPGAMKLIKDEHRMTDEQAREFGRLTGHCVVCSRLLTDPKSIEAGIGPVCSGKR